MLQSRPFVLKEGVDYRVKVSFKVRLPGHLTPPVGSVPLWGSLPTLGTHTAPGITATLLTAHPKEPHRRAVWAAVGWVPLRARHVEPLTAPLCPAGEQGDRLWAEVPAPDVPPRPAG